MSLGIGERIPDTILQTMEEGQVRSLSSQEALGEGRVLLFAVPGPFTPACSETHLPGYLLRVDELAEAGVERIACVAVSDAFVMDAWGRDRGVGDRIVMLADGNGDFTRAMGLGFDARRFGQGFRSRRYAALLEDGVLRELQVEPAGEVTVSGAESLLDRLRG